MQTETRDIQQLTDRFVHAHVHAHAGDMVEYILKQVDDIEAPFDWDDVLNVYPNATDWDVEQCEAYILDVAGKQELNDLREDYGDYLHLDYDDYLDTLRDWIRDNAEPQEPLEWYIVSQWLCDKLDDQGEVVIFPNIWGRTTSGQAIYMDDNIQQLAVQFAPVTD